MLEDWRKIGDEDGPDVLTAMRNLSLTERRRGMLENIERLQARVLEGWMMIGDKSPSILATMSNLALMRIHRRKLEAERLREQALESWKKIGAESPSMLTAMSDLAPTKRDRGKSEEAEQLGEQALEGWKKIG